VVTLPNQGHGFLSLEHAPQWADVSVKTIKRWLSRGLPSYQEGPRTKVLIRPSDIEEFLTKRQVPQSDLDVMVADVMVGLRNKIS